MDADKKTLTVVTWNIGGGMISLDGRKYDQENINYFIEQIKPFEPDFVCLQEVHTSRSTGKSSQVDIFSESLELKYHVTVAISPSHLGQEQSLSLSTFSRQPITWSIYSQLDNPQLKTVGPNGEPWVLFDKGFLTSQIDFFGRRLRVVNGHFHPLYIFGRNPLGEEFTHIRYQVEAIIASNLQDESTPCIVAVDLNYEDAQAFMPGVFHKDFRTAFKHTATIPQGIQYDHILYSKHFDKIKAQVLPGHADHYLCVVELRY